MYQDKKILAVIPARGGSKRVPKKNIKLLAGKPLIAYTIEAAKNSPIIDKVIVSTDSSEIAEVAKQYGAEVPFMRPEELSGDTVSDHPVILHALDYLKNEGQNFDYVLYLKPTAPFRTTEDIEEAIKTLYDQNVPLVRSVSIARGVHHPYWMYKIKDGIMEPLIEGVRLKDYYRGQMLPKDIVNLNGMVEAYAVDHAYNSDFINDADRIGYIIIPDDRAVDIDEEMDFQICENIINNK